MADEEVLRFVLDLQQRGTDPKKVLAQLLELEKVYDRLRAKMAQGGLELGGTGAQGQGRPGSQGLGRGADPSSASRSSGIDLSGRAPGQGGLPKPTYAEAIVAARMAVRAGAEAARMAGGPAAQLAQVGGTGGSSAGGIATPSAAMVREFTRALAGAPGVTGRQLPITPQMAQRYEIRSGPGSGGGQGTSDLAQLQRSLLSLFEQERIRNQAGTLESIQRSRAIDRTAQDDPASRMNRPTGLPNLTGGFTLPSSATDNEKEALVRNIQNLISLQQVEVAQQRRAATRADPDSMKAVVEAMRRQAQAMAITNPVTRPVAPAQVAPAQVAPAQVAPAQVAPAQVAPAPVAPAQVAYPEGSAGRQSLQAQQRIAREAAQRAARDDYLTAYGLQPGDVKGIQGLPEGGMQVRPPGGRGDGGDAYRYQSTVAQAQAAANVLTGDAPPSTGNWRDDLAVRISGTTAPAAPDWTCVSCQTRNSGSEKYCSRCGHGRDASISRPAQSASSVGPEAQDLVARTAGVRPFIDPTALATERAIGRVSQQRPHFGPHGTQPRRRSTTNTAPRTPVSLMRGEDAAGASAFGWDASGEGFKEPGFLGVHSVEFEQIDAPSINPGGVAGASGVDLSGDPSMEALRASGLLRNHPDVSAASSAAGVFADHPDHLARLNRIDRRATDTTERYSSSWNRADDFVSPMFSTGSRGRGASGAQVFREEDPYGGLDPWSGLEAVSGARLDRPPGPREPGSADSGASPAGDLSRVIITEVAGLPGAVEILISGIKDAADALRVFENLKNDGRNGQRFQASVAELGGDHGVDILDPIRDTSTGAIARPLPPDQLRVVLHPDRVNPQPSLTEGPDAPQELAGLQQDVERASRPERSHNVADRLALESPGERSDREFAEANARAEAHDRATRDAADAAAAQAAIDAAGIRPAPRPVSLSESLDPTGIETPEARATRLEHERVAEEAAKAARDASGASIDPRAPGTWSREPVNTGRDMSVPELPGGGGGTWTCLIDGTANPDSRGACSMCGHPRGTTMADLAGAGAGAGAGGGGGGGGGTPPGVNPALGPMNGPPEMTWMQRNFSRFGRVVIPGEAGKGEWSGGNRVQQIAALPKNIGSVMKAVGLPGGQMMETVGHQAASIGQGVQGIAAFAPDGVASTLGPLLLGLGGITAVSVAVVAGLNEMVKGAALYNTKIRKLSESTGQSVEEVSQSYSRLGSIMGGETAAAAIAGIGRAQTSAAASPRDIAIDLVAQKSVAMGGYNPALQGTAAFGIGKFKQGSTYQNPLFKNPEEYALDAGSRLASLKDEQRAIAIARIKAESGDEAGTLATRMATKFTKGRAEGKTDEQIKAEVTRESSNRAYVPTANDIANLDKYNEAQARLSLAMEKAGVALGELFLPLWSGFISALATGFEWLAAAASATSKWFDTGAGAASNPPGSGKHTVGPTTVLAPDTPGAPGKAGGPRAAGGGIVLPPRPGAPSSGGATGAGAPGTGSAGGAGSAGPTSPAIVAAQVTLTKAESAHTPGGSDKEIEAATIALTKAYTDQGLSAAEAAAQVKKIKDANAAAAATAAQAGSPLKSLDNNLKTLEGAWKGVDFPKSASEAKIWGETTSTAFTTAGATKDAMLINWEKLITAAKTQPNLVTTTTTNTNTNTTATTKVNVEKGTIFTPEKLADMIVKVSTEQGAVFKPEQIADMIVKVNTVEGAVFTPRDIARTIVMVDEMLGKIVTPEQKAAIEVIVNQIWGNRVDTSNIVTTQTINQVQGVTLPNPNPQINTNILPTEEENIRIGVQNVASGSSQAINEAQGRRDDAGPPDETESQRRERIRNSPPAQDPKARLANPGADETDADVAARMAELYRIARERRARETFLAGGADQYSQAVSGANLTGTAGANAIAGDVLSNQNMIDYDVRMGAAGIDVTSTDASRQASAARALNYGSMSTSQLGINQQAGFAPNWEAPNAPTGDVHLEGINPGTKFIEGTAEVNGHLEGGTRRITPLKQIGQTLAGISPEDLQKVGTGALMGVVTAGLIKALQGDFTPKTPANPNKLQGLAPGSEAEVAGVAVSNTNFIPNQFDGGRLNGGGGNRSGQPTVIDRAAEKAVAATEDAAASLGDGADASAAAADDTNAAASNLGDASDALTGVADDTQGAARDLAGASDALTGVADDTQGAADNLAISAQTGADNELGIVASVTELAGKVAKIHIYSGTGSSGTGTTTGTGSSGTGTTTGTGSSGTGTTTTGNNGATTTDSPPAAEDHSAPDGGSWANYNSYDNQQARANAAAAALAAAQQKAKDDAAAAGSGSATQIGGGYWLGGVTGGTWVSTYAEGGIATRSSLGVFGEAGPEALIPLERLPEMVAAIGGSRSGGRWGDPGDRSEPGGYGGRDTGTQVTINTTINLQGADFSDPQFINRLSRSVGDAIMEKVRMGGLGRVS